MTGFALYQPMHWEAGYISKEGAQIEAYDLISTPRESIHL